MMFPEGGGEGDLDGMVFPKPPPGEPPKPFPGHRHCQLERTSAITLGDLGLQ